MADVNLTLLNEPVPSPSPTFQRFRRRLMFGLLAMTFLAILILFWGLRSAYKERVGEGKAQTANLGRAVEAHVRQTIQFADLSLIGVSKAINALDAEKGISLPALQALMTSQSAYSSEFSDIYIDAHGNGVFPPTRDRSYFNKEFFTVHAQARDQGLYIGGPEFDQTSGQRFFFISRRIETPSGHFIGVVAAKVDATRLAQTFQNARFSNGVVIMLAHRDGHVISHVPSFKETFAKDLSKSALFKELKNGKEGSFQATSTVDRQARIYSFRALDDMPLVVGVGVKDLAWESSISSNLAIGGGGVLLMLAIMLLSTQFALHSYAKVEERQKRYRRLYDSSHATEAKLAESEKRLRLIADNLPVIIAYVDSDERYTFANKKFENVFGIAHASIAGRHAIDVVGEETYTKSRKYMDAALNGETVYFERNVTRGNKRVWDAVSYIPDRDKDGQVIGYFSMVEDITERKKSEESKLLHTLVFEHTSEGMIITDLSGAIISVNPAFSKLSGYDVNDVIGKHLSDLASTRHDKDFFEDIRKCIAQCGQWKGEVWNQHKNGEQYLISITFNTVCNQEGVPFRRIALFSDITKKKANDELIWKQANFDALTGLPNRRMFHDRLRIEMKKSDRSGMAMGLIFIDLDHFKEINDTLGHDLGDALLKETAQRLTMSVRGTDTVARLGGDEFTVILSELNEPNDVTRIAQEILKRMEEPFKLGDNKAYISASIGATLYPNDGATVEALLKNADQAMYAAKQQGRNRFNYFAPFMQEAMQVRVMLTNELREALDQEQLRVVYQPIIELSTGEIRKAEALVRWQHPSRGLLNPAEFIGIAEATGLIVRIGDWIFHQAAQEAKRLRQTVRNDFQICVNKSALQFREDGSHYRDWLRHLDALQLPASSVVIEVTENSLQDASSAVTDKLLAFRDAGMQVALDDFGTGYSSLSFLRQFDIDYLKIAPSFLGNLRPSSEDVILCEAMIAMAHKLGMKVIAEGVETIEQHAFLLEAGCDYGQGYLFSRPVKAEELEELLQSRQLNCG
jgi:diguanylate cyclase (GGDEF)-like protein/PAS domain S-box-containing protein